MTADDEEHVDEGEVDRSRDLHSTTHHIRAAFMNRQADGQLPRGL